MNLDMSCAPAPWTYSPHSGTGGRGICGQIFDAEGNSLAAMTDLSAEADAAGVIMAAAPDLADALRKVLPFVEAEAKVRIDSFTPPPGGFPPITPDEQDVIDEAQAAVDTIRAALAKLEG